MKRKLVTAVIAFVLLVSMSAAAFATSVSYSVSCAPYGGSGFTSSAKQDVAASTAGSNTTSNSGNVVVCARVYTSSGSQASNLKYFTTGSTTYTYSSGHGGAGNYYKLKIENGDTSVVGTMVKGTFETSR